MKQLTPLVKPPAYIERFRAIRDAKHQATRRKLVEIHELIERRYDQLEQAHVAGNLQSLEADAASDAVKHILRACYDSSTKPLVALKGAIRDAQPPRLLKYCPMCGTTIHSTFDHYLPAEHFPEFAVHPLNLVPCCATCNSTKGDVWLVDGKRTYLHAFSNDVPDTAFIRVTLHEAVGLSGVGATFSIVWPEDVDDRVRHLVESHFSRLHILERYNELGNNEIAEIIASCRIFLDNAGEDVANFLKTLSIDLAENHGWSHWRSRLMHALAEHPSLLSWAENQRKPIPE